MGVFSGWLDNLATREFGKDEGGRLAFFPYGWRRPGYYLETGDQPKIRALVTIYKVAAALINAVGSTAAIVFTLVMVDDERYSPLRRKLELSLSVYAIAGLLSYILPLLLLWQIYRGLIRELCSSLSTVGPESIRRMQPAPRGLGFVILLFAGVLLIGLGIFAAVGYRR